MQAGCYSGALAAGPDPLRFFGSGHLPARLRIIAQTAETVAALMVLQLPDCDERRAGLRHLLEAKECFVRAAL